MTARDYRVSAYVCWLIAAALWAFAMLLSQSGCSLKNGIDAEGHIRPAKPNVPPIPAVPATPAPPAPRPKPDRWWNRPPQPKGLSISVPSAALGDASAAEVSMTLIATAAREEAVNPAAVDSFDEWLSINNTLRASAGKSPQRLDLRLCQAAQEQADWCANHGYTFHSRGSAHEFGNGTHSTRAARYGFHGATAENMAGNSDDIAMAFRQWQKSPGHARTLYSNEYDRCGFGMATNHLGQKLYFALYGRESAGAE